VLGHGVLHFSRDAEVCEPHVASSGQEHISSLDVAMDPFPHMQPVHRQQNAFEDLGYLSLAERRAREWVAVNP
jgi:hypothetical protein